AYHALHPFPTRRSSDLTTLWNIPVAPSALRITTITSSSVSLAWTDNSNNETGFKIQRKQGATGIYTTIKTTAAYITTYTDSDSALLDGTQYYYKVSATNSAGDSAYSNEVNGVTTMRARTEERRVGKYASIRAVRWTDMS